MEEQIICPNCLGYGCCVIFAGTEPTLLCPGFDIISGKCVHNNVTECSCHLCNKTGMISWIDLLFEFKNKKFSVTFERLRNNIEEVEKIIEVLKNGR